LDKESAKLDDKEFINFRALTRENIEDFETAYLKKNHFIVIKKDI